MCQLSLDIVDRARHGFPGNPCARLTRFTWHRH
jgi:hypothetical protein